MSSTTSSTPRTAFRGNPVDREDRVVVIALRPVGESLERVGTGRGRASTAHANPVDPGRYLAAHLRRTRTPRPTAFRGVPIQGGVGVPVGVLGGDIGPPPDTAPLRDPADRWISLPSFHPQEFFRGRATRVASRCCRCASRRVRPMCRRRVRRARSDNADRAQSDEQSQHCRCRTRVASPRHRSSKTVTEHDPPRSSPAERSLKLAELHDQESVELHQSRETESQSPKLSGLHFLNRKPRQCRIPFAETLPGAVTVQQPRRPRHR